MKTRHPLLVLTTAVLLSAIFSLVILFVPPHHAPAAEETIVIRQGMTTAHIAGLLREHRVIGNTDIFLAVLKITGKTRKVQAGAYRFDTAMSLSEVIRTLVAGKVMLRKVTVPEGVRVERIAAILEASLSVDSAAVMSAVTDSLLCDSLNIPTGTLEGYLYPDTYFFPLGVDAETVVSTMLGRFFSVITDSLHFEPDSSALSLHELVTLASIIEGEVMLDSERRIVSALYHNRLAKRMYLESCPTIQYIIPDGPRRIYERDLHIESPYNTYRHFGLPPGPVGNPGLKSLYAAMHPASTDVLFMVAAGDGSHTFSRTLSGHLKAKRQLDRLRRRIAEKERMSE
ncbi:endolytic transglycosylase MltG [bacterium]|nr:endolytic transglycosylase MltG [bacterium]